MINRIGRCRIQTRGLEVLRLTTRPPQRVLGITIHWQDTMKLKCWLGCLSSKKYFKVHNFFLMRRAKKICWENRKVSTLKSLRKSISNVLIKKIRDRQISILFSCWFSINVGCETSHCCVYFVLITDIWKGHLFDNRRRSWEKKFSEGKKLILKVIAKKWTELLSVAWNFTFNVLFFFFRFFSWPIPDFI